MQLAIGLIIFIATFYLIITEKVPGPIATLLGGLSMALVGIINEHEALHAIGSRLEIILLLVGMMIIVHFISETGVFQYLAVKVAQLVKGEPFPLLVLLAVITAVCSAFLDNVTTILLMAPVSILLANQLKVDPFVYIMTLIMSANIGGLATLIGDPTQLIIGAEGKLGFNDFLINTAPVAIISLVVLLITVYFMYGRKMIVSRDLKARVMELDASRSLKDMKLLQESATIFALVIFGFLMNNFIDKGLAIMALTGAVVLILITKREPIEVFKHVEWDTLFFFMGLFMLIQGIEATGIVDLVGDKVLELADGHLHYAAAMVLWVSAAFTSVIGNVANAAMVSKIIHFMLPTFSGGNTMSLWWALSMGSLLGGNITILASATNVVAINSANKAGCKISFGKFMKFGIVIAVQTLIIANIYLFVKYF
ncbi:ArsB/NhaD family transporter [Fusobacteria bacterium ZRK30]|nr:ArsB/NhaD family transporter [Fusobacteria bacterium ZRK30]UUV19601.1 ArsB/NhaD family transporter [Fusobacteria bacterium ZRK30]